MSTSISTSISTDLTQIGLSTAHFSRTGFSRYRRQIVDSQKWYWFDQIGWNPITPQMAAHLAPQRNRYTTSGRRGGKTAWVSKEGSAYMVSGPYSVALVGPNYDLVSSEWNNIKTDLQHPANPHTITAWADNPRAGDLYISLSNGSEVQGFSAAQPGKYPIVSKEWDFLILCEGARIPNLDTLWETQLKGNLSTRLGDMACPTTPKGRDKFLYPRFLAAERGEDDEGFAIRWPAWENIEGFQEDVSKLKSQLSPRAWQQEVLGLFVSWEGAIWIEDGGFDRRVNVIPPLEYIPPWWNRIEVLDPAFSDWGLWGAAVVDDSGVIRVIDEYKFKLKTYSDLAREIIRRRRNMYGDNIPSFIPLYVDPERPEARTELHKASVELERGKPIQSLITCRQADNRVEPGFEVGAGLLQSSMVFITEDCRYIIDCLENHEWAETMTASGNKNQKRDEWIHGSDWFRYLALAPRRPSRKPEEEEKYTGEKMSDILNIGNRQRKNENYIDYIRRARGMEA